MGDYLFGCVLAWKIHNEDFLKNFKDINELKLRVGYGLTNNQNVRDFAYTSTLATVATGLSGISQLTENIGNPYVEWEKTKYSNIGHDAALPVLAPNLLPSIFITGKRTVF